MELNREMTNEEAIKWLVAIEEKYIHGGDENYDEQRRTALRLARNALSLIKELTAENKLLNVELGNANSEILRLIDEKKELTRKLKCAELQIEAKERICESYMLQYGTVADKEVWLKKERADTVRKMHSEIKERCIKGGIYPAFVASTIDQIAKEMSEGEK